MTEAQIIKDAIERHGIKLDTTDVNLIDLVRYARHIGSNEGYKLWCTQARDFPRENLSKEQVERYRAAFRCLELAQANKEEKDFDLIALACEYGAGMNLTREECEKLLNMKVRDVINLEI